MTRDDLVLAPMGLRFLGRLFPCSIGRGGTTLSKREGDRATPCGTHRIVGCLYRPDRMTKPCAWAVPIRPGDLWCDDPDSSDYNHKVRAPFEHGHEALRRPDHLYDLILVTNWNWPRAEWGAGSAIFLHRWRKPGHPTEGCIALRPDHLLWIAARIAPGTRLRIHRDGVNRS